MTRTAICLIRLSTDASVKVVLELKRPFRDATTHILFSPEDFLAQLAALVPRPRSNLTRYHGVCASNCKLRSAVVPHRKGTAAGSITQRRRAEHAAPAAEPDIEPQTPLTWAQRLKRVFLIDISLCPHCGGTLRVI